MTEIPLVDKKDKIIKYEEKEKSHKIRGLLHRAFSIFIFNKNGELLTQKRSKFKKLWPLYWSDTCSSHPQKGQTIGRAAKERLKEELGFICRLKLLGKIRYSAIYKKIGSENEICTFFAGRYDGKIKPDPKEIAELKWMDFYELKRDMNKNSKKYTPWLKIAAKKFSGELINWIK